MTGSPVADAPRRCRDCGFDPSEVRDRDLAAAVRALGDRWVVFIDSFEHRHDHGDELLHGHPGGHASAHEHGRHLRDRLLALAEPLERSLTTGTAPARWRDEPDAESWPAADRDDPDVLVGQITSVTDTLAGLLGGNRHPSGDATQIARFALHEGYHHLAVAERAVAAQMPDA